MKYFKIIVIGGLCASLIFNYILLTKLSDMDNKINNVSSYQHQVINTVNSQVGSINNAINKIKEEQSWLSTVNFETVLDDTARNEAEVSFEWQVKELQNASEVLFNYRMGEDKEYTSFKAEAKGNGFFRVMVPIEVNAEPNWNIQITGNNLSQRSMRDIELKAIEDNKGALARRINYYISVTHGDILKSSEIDTAYIDDIGARYYGYLEVLTDIGVDNYSLTVIGRKAYDTAIYFKEAYLKKYRDGQLVDEEKLEKESIIYKDGMPAREDSEIFHTRPSEGKMDYSSLLLKIIYSDGSVFEREVYSK